VEQSNEICQRSKVAGKGRALLVFCPLDGSQNKRPSSRAGRCCKWISPQDVVLLHWQPHKCPLHPTCCCPTVASLVVARWACVRPRSGLVTGTGTGTCGGKTGSRSVAASQCPRAALRHRDCSSCRCWRCPQPGQMRRPRPTALPLICL
jgi:hypothetical protein